MRRTLIPVLFGSNYSQEAKTLFAAMTTQPSAARKSLIDSTIKSLKSAGIWSKLDAFYVLAAHDSQAARLNWVAPGTYTALAVNSPTFQTDRGYTGDGATSRLRTQYTPSINGVQYSLNSASGWVWVRTNIAENVADIGSLTAPRIFIQSQTSTNMLSTDINNAAGAASSSAIATSVGFSGAQRRGSTDRRVWKNGSQQSADAVASTSLPTQEQWICGASTTQFSVKQVAAAVWGASLSGLESSFYNTLLAYMQGVGAA